jgi:hypothetical protein
VKIWGVPEGIPADWVQPGGWAMSLSSKQQARLKEIVAEVHKSSRRVVHPAADASSFGRMVGLPALVGSSADDWGDAFN